MRTGSVVLPASFSTAASAAAASAVGRAEDSHREAAKDVKSLVADIEAGIREGRKEDWMFTPAGQSVVGIDKIQPAAEVVYKMAEEAQEQFERFSGVPVS